METLSNLAFGLGIALSWQNILYCFIGCFLGTLVGVLPGIGPVATVAMLLPFTFGLEPAPALIMLAGIYYGAQYGGSTTAILVNIPGESSSVVTTLDGHQMARRGRAGPALGIAAIGSFIAGCIATLVVAFFAPPLAEIARAEGWQTLHFERLGRRLAAVAFTLLATLAGIGASRVAARRQPQPRRPRAGRAGRR